MSGECNICGGLHGEDSCTTHAANAYMNGLNAGYADGWNAQNPHLSALKTENTRLRAEVERLRRVEEVAIAYLKDWDAQVANPRAMCYECEDHEWITRFRAALTPQQPATGGGGG